MPSVFSPWVVWNLMVAHSVMGPKSASTRSWAFCTTLRRCCHKPVPWPLMLGVSKRKGIPGHVGSGAEAWTREAAV